MKNRLVFLTITAFILAACSPIEPTSEHVATTNPAPESTATPHPTYTKPPPTPTLSPNEIASGVFSDLTIETQRLVSLDGRCTWDRLIAFPLKEASFYKYNNQIYKQVIVACVPQDPQKWVLVDDWTAGGMGYSIPALLGWSADGEHLYLHDEVIPDGCQPIGGFQENFRQVDLSTGKISLLFPELRSGASLSPDSTRIVYYDLQARDVGLYFIASGEVQHYPLTLPEPPNSWGVGDFTWSPDGQSLLFVMVVGDACNPEGASIQRIDLEKGEVSTVFTSTGQPASILEWLEADSVLISIGQEKKTLDPLTGTLY